MPSLDSVSVLRCASGFTATKHWADPTTCRDYNAGSLYHVHSAPVSSLTELAALLDKLRAAPRMFVIRAEPKLGVSMPVVRRHKQPADPFEDRGRRWVMLDLDTRPDPDGTFPSDPAGAAAEVRRTLPRPFQNAACYWHASNSAGIKPGVRLHLWFWCSRPVDCAEWRAWSKQWSVSVDASVFRAVQPHYTADPQQGFPDPKAARTGVLQGEPEVVVPEIVGTSFALQTLADATLDRAVRKIKAAQQGERNSTLYRQSCLVAAFAPLLGDRARTHLEDAAAAAQMGATEVVATIESAFSSAPLHPACDRQSWSRGMDINQQGQFSTSPANVLTVLLQHPECMGLLERDVRTQETRVSRTPPWDPDEIHGPYPRRLADHDAHEFCVWLGREAKITGVQPRSAIDSMIAACQRRRVDVFRDWLETLEWDGTARLDSWLQRITGSPDDAVYLAAVGKRWLISAVARTMAPGCKADCMLVLVGAQGLRKSTLFERLAGTEWYRVLQSALGGDDAYMQLQGPVIVEISDLAGMSGRSIETIKADLSTAADERRPKYGRTVERFPRRCVYAGTTNEDKFLHDVTGGRRFWPVHVDRFIDTDALSAERDQLWAEALHLYRTGEQWHLTPEENALACTEQADAREPDLLEEAIQEILDTPVDPMRARAIGRQLDTSRRYVKITCMDILRLLDAPAHTISGRRVSNALRALGWIQKRDGVARWYHKP